MYSFRFFKKHIVLIGYIFFSLAASAGAYIDFFRAILRDDAYSTRQLLSAGFDPNTVSESAQPALLFALRQESYKAAKTLIDDPRTQLNLTNPQGESPLMMAALKEQTALVEQLLALGASINKPGWSPLHYAAASTKTDILAILLAHDADLNAASPNGTTPLMMAARYGSPQSVKLLLAAGANPELKNQNGLTALDFARQGARPDAQKILEQALDRPQWPDSPDQPIQY